MKIDLHVHASERSGCSVAQEESLIQAAMQAGLDALCFTDHHAFIPWARLQNLNATYAPFRIFRGIEISTTDQEDILVIGVDAPELETADWSYADLYQLVRDADGFLALAHPFRFHDDVRIDTVRYPPDAIEGRSANIDPHRHKLIDAFIASAERPMLCNSDAHAVNMIGGHCNELAHPVMETGELIKILKQGRFTCHCHSRENTSV